MEVNIIKKNLSFSEFNNFINDCVDLIFERDDNNNIFNYLPELYDFAIRYTFYMYYTNYNDKDDSNDSKKIEDIYQELISLNVYDNIRYCGDDAINIRQFDVMIKAINDKIEFNKTLLINDKTNELNSLLKGLTSFINTMESKFKNIDLSKLNDLSKLSGKINNLSDTKFVNALAREIHKNNKK